MVEPASGGSSASATPVPEMMVTSGMAEFVSVCMARKMCPARVVERVRNAVSNLMVVVLLLFVCYILYPNGVFAMLLCRLCWFKPNRTPLVKSTVVSVSEWTGAMQLWG